MVASTRTTAVTFLLLMTVMSEISFARESQILEEQATNIRHTPYKSGFEVVQIPPNTIKPRHYHTGPEIGYVLQGELSIFYDNQPVKVIHRGEAFLTPPGLIHQTQTGPTGATVVASWLVKREQQLAITITH